MVLDCNHIELAVGLNCYVILELALLPAVFGHNQAPLPVQCGFNPAPAKSGDNLAMLLVILAKEAKAFLLFQLI